jgi:phytoene desaturase
VTAARVVVVGGGVGGLATAIRLASAGYETVLVERNEVVGGKLAVHTEAGYVFDVGPSLVTLPHLYDETFRVAGTTLADEVDLVRLDPAFHYHWPDGAHLVVPDDPQALVAALDGFAPGTGAGDAWRRRAGHNRRIWEVAERTFFAGPMGSPRELASRMRSPLDLLAIDPLRTLHRAAASTFDDPRLQQWVGRYATYSGSSPYRAPATLACIPHVEQHYGCWYPQGGLGALRDAFERVARRAGAELRTGTEVVRVLADDTRVEGVLLASGERLEADAVVVNADAEHLYLDLLPDDAALRRVRRADPSTSGFVLCLGVRGPTPGIGERIGHHTVWFSRDYRAEFAALDAGRLAEDPTIYACISSVTDPTQAPPGGENWFLLVNTPAGAAVDPEAYGALVLARLAEQGVELRDRIEVRHHLTPQDLAERYRSPGGAIYGTSSNGRRAAFVRPANRGARAGLYLVGGSSHPGGGLPLVTTSARIVAELVTQDLAADQLPATRRRGWRR